MFPALVLFGGAASLVFCTTVGAVAGASAGATGKGVRGGLIVWVALVGVAWLSWVAS